jgi:hypothetical protein
MHLPGNRSLLATELLTATALLSLLPVHAQIVIGDLDGVSAASTFETGSTDPLPNSGWVNVSGTAQIYGGGVANGALIGTTPYDNYTVQFDTSTPIQPNTAYTFTVQMGYFAALADGDSGYSFQLGTVNGGVFTGLGTPATGTVPYLGNMSEGNWSSGPISQTFTTGATVSGDNLSVQWSQISALGGGTSDHFGFDNATLTAVPEPGEYAVIAGAALLGFVAWRRHVSSPRHGQRPRVA